MKTALIWGAGGGIGRALVAQLSEHGWTVIAIARHATALSVLTPYTLEADVASTYDVEVAVQAASQIADEVNLWIYAAGDIVPAKVADMSPAEWQRTLNANLSGAFITTHFSLPLLSADAHLFYLGALSERLRLPGFAAYGAAKAGLEAFAESLAKEQRRRKVTVVRPGAVATPFWEKVPLRMPESALPTEIIAERLLAAYEQRTAGVLDIS